MDRYEIILGPMVLWGQLVKIQRTDPLVQPTLQIQDVNREAPILLTSSYFGSRSLRLAMVECETKLSQRKANVEVDINRSVEVGGGVRMFVESISLLFRGK